MSRLKHRSSRVQARWLALVGVALWVLGWASPARAAADPSCASAEAISELEPDERARLRQLCEGASTPGPQDKATLEAGLRLEGWKAAFVARALARATPPPPEAVEPQRGHEAWVASLLARTRKQRGKEVPACATLRDLVTGSVRDLEAGRLAIPASLHDLEADEGCVPSDERERLERLVAGWRLLTIPRRDEDRVEAFSVDFDQLSVHGVEPIPFDAEGHSAWLLLLPEDRMVTVSVTQPDLDVPWVETRRMADIDFTLSRRRAECVIIEAGTDVGSTWSVVVNGEPTPLEVVSTHQQGRLTQRAILALPQDPRSEQAQLTGGVRSVRQVVFISAGVEPWASSLAEPRDEDHGRCRSVAYDLTGLHSPQEQIGVAQVSVDRQCRNRGIVPSRVRSYAESYTEQANKKLIPLDAWAEVMEVFRELEGRLGSQTSAERGASRGDLDDSEQMIVLASELRRRGVDSLLYFDVRCPQSSMDVTVIGTRVDLDDFVGRARSRVTGIDTDELLDVRSHDSRSRDLRESMEVVLSDLLGRSYVRFVDPPAEIERGRPRRLRAVGVDTGVEIEIWPLRNADGAALCPHVDEINALSSFDAFATIRRTVVDRIGRAQLRHRDAGGHADVEVGGLLPGDYLALATAVDPKDGGRRDDRIGHARCFSVHQRELELTFDIAGFKQWTQPRNTPVSTRQSFVRIGAGVRYTNWEYFEFGGRLGYELVEYTTEVVPSWDDLLLVELPPDGRVPISWRRHGLFVSPFVGVRVPFGRWPRITCGKGPDCATIKERRRANPALMTYFVDAQVAVNFGIADISSLPPELVASESSAVLEPDLDLGLKTGVRVRPRQVAGFGVFAGVLLTDLTNARTINARQQEFWTNDWGVRGIVGIELGLGLRGKRS